MKKIIAYLVVLGMVFVLLRLGFSDLGREVTYELDGAGVPGAASAALGHAQPGGNEMFNNEVAQQQEVVNLANENTPPAPAAAAAAAAAVAAEPAKGRKAAQRAGDRPRDSVDV